MSSLSLLLGIHYQRLKFPSLSAKTTDNVSVYTEKPTKHPPPLLLIFIIIMSTTSIASNNDRLAATDFVVPTSDSGSDSTSSLAWNKTNHLVSTNWDGCVRLWGVQKGRDETLQAVPQLMCK